jgi:CheY-like chemotaxis protein
MNSSEKESNRRILVVDDEADVLEFLKMDLEPLGWEVVTALSAAEAVRKLERRPYFCVLSDIAMPDMDRAKVAATVLQAWQAYNGLSADDDRAKPASS